MIISNFLFMIFYISIFNVYSFNIELNIQTNKFQNGPENYGIGMGHSSTNGNWPIFLERLGVNAARLFVDAGTKLRTIVDAKKWGQNLDGELVNNRNDFLKSIKQLRTENARNPAYNWSNPGFEFIIYKMTLNNK
jgi:hypothetical protein